MRLSALPFLAVLALLIAACSNGSPSTPSEVAEQFLRAVKSGDQVGLGQSMTPVAFAETQGDQGFAMNGDQMDSYTLGVETIEGDSARVAVQVLSKGQSQDAKLMLRRSSGDWRVHGMAVSFGGAEMAFDFENTQNLLESVGQELGQQLGEELANQMQGAMEDAQMTWEQGGTEEEIAAERQRFESIVAVPAEQHERVWQMDVDGRGHSALDILRALVEPSGLRVDPGEHAKLLARPCNFVARAVSRVQAVEGLCEAIGLHPVWPATHATAAHWGEAAPAPDPLTFALGERPYPAVFAGPFLVEVTELLENTPQPTGELHVAVRSLGLAASVLGFQQDMLEVLRIETLSDATGASLADVDTYHMGEPDVRERYFVYSLRKELKGLLRPVETLATVKGQVRLQLPSVVHTTTLERGQSGTVEVAGGTLEIRSWGTSPRMSLKGVEAETTEVVLSPRRANGDPIGVRFQSADGWNQKIDASLDCPEDPAFVDVKICTREEVFYDFVLPPVPLVSFADRPAALEALTFTGIAPMAFNQQGPLRRENGMAQLKLEIQNVSNKDIVSAMVRFEYLDGEGTVLKDFPHTLSGEYDFDLKDTAPLAYAGQATSQDAHAAFAPDAAVTVLFELMSVEFSDGTRWEL